MKRTLIKLGAGTLVAGLVLFAAPTLAHAEGEPSSPSIAVDQPAATVSTGSVPATSPAGEPTSTEASSIPTTSSGTATSDTPPATVSDQPTTAEPVGDPQPITSPPLVAVPLTKELIWVLPNGGTGSNVTWPQPVYDPSAPITCDTTITLQHDAYPYSSGADVTRTDALDDDGLLLEGEDYGWAQSWYFTTVTGPACAPPAPLAIACTSTGTAYTESDDHAPADIPAGKSFVSQGDHTPVEFGYPVTGNLQGLSSITSNYSDVVGNGIFIRVVVDLTGDGLGSYNSLSVTDTTLTQASVANVGSKSVFLGKSISQIAAEFPNNRITSIHWQTGSSYAAGDGATLTSVSGDCLNVSYVQPPVENPPTDEPPVVIPPVVDQPTTTVDQPAAAIKTERTSAKVLASTGTSKAEHEQQMDWAAMALVGFVIGFMLVQLGRSRRPRN